MTDVERIGGRVVLLDKGKVRLDRDLDALREDICMAMVPRASAANAAVIEEMPGCLGVRLVLDEWHAIFNGPSEAVHRDLRETLGVNGIRCVSLPLEELFIEMVGGDRKEVGAA